MFLPHTVQYALRVVAILATREGPDSASAQTLAEEASVPPAYLSKVLRKLVVAGLVSARKGPGGGYALARKPEEIVLSEVLAAMGFALDGTECVFGWSRCDGTNPCPLHPLWAELQGSVRHWCESNTLRSVLHRPPALLELRRRGAVK